jgi:hypothetical protein
LAMIPAGENAFRLQPVSLNSRPRVPTHNGVPRDRSSSLG